MTVIRTQQMKLFEQAALRQFEEEMMAHGKSLSPRLCEVIGDEQLLVALRAAMTKADSYGFTNRGPIRLYIEMMFFCGSAFDTDPQYSAVGQVLRASGDQMQRAEQIHEGYLDYLEKVSGPGAVNVHKALKDLLDLVRMPVAHSGDFETSMLYEVNRIFPLKAAYVGEAALRALIEEGIAEARQYRFDTGRQTALLVVLKFAFGHGCTDDPLYPWISRTLRDERTIDPAGRAARLENKAITWL
ncbi:MAG: hypothetical protein ACKV2U_27750, partial [Bryobacteraceae bacterium]